MQHTNGDDAFAKTRHNDVRIRTEPNWKKNIKIIMYLNVVCALCAHYVCLNVLLHIVRVCLLTHTNAHQAKSAKHQVYKYIQFLLLSAKMLVYNHTPSVSCVDAGTFSLLFGCWYCLILLLMMMLLLHIFLLMMLRSPKQALYRFL